MKRLLLHLPLALCICLGSPLHAQSTPTSAQEEATGTHAAPLAIDGTPIPWVEFASWLGQLQGPTRIEDYVRQVLIEREFKAAGLQLDASEVEARVQAEIRLRVDGAFEGVRAGWLAELKQLGLTEASYLAERSREVQLELLVDRLAQSRRVITQDNLRSAWEREHGPAGRAMHVSRIFLSVRSVPQPEGITRDENIARQELAKAEALERAMLVFRDLENGADFAASALAFSEDDASRDQGGALPGTLVLSDWPGIDREALLALEVGDVMTPFHAGGGYNILRLDRMTVTPFEQVAKRLEQELKAAPADQVEVAKLRASLQAAAQIEWLPELRRDVDGQTPRLQRPVVVVDGQALSREAFERWLLASHGRNFLRTFMEHRWIAEQARLAHCEPSALDVEQRVQADTDRQIASFFKGDREAWLADLAGKGQSLEDHMRLVQLRTRHNLRAERLALRERQVTEDMVRRAWELRYGVDGQALDVRFLMRTIPLPAEGSLTSVEQVDAYIADQSREIVAFLGLLRERVEDGEDFGALVRTHSDDPLTRDRGGRQANRFELHKWSAEVQSAVRKLQPGGVTEPVAMSQEFFLFELVGLLHVPFEDVADELRAELQTRRPSAVEIAGFINEKTRTITVEALPGLLE